jgi:aspartate/tyrosine/aromatic aminotransferase
MSIFSSCTLAPPDPILNMSVAYKQDTHAQKVDLGVGAYRDAQGKPLIFKAVKEAEIAIMNDAKENHEYTTIEGPSALKPLCLKVLFGDSVSEADMQRTVSSQSISGTGALRLAAEFIALHCNKPRVYVSDPTWGNHIAIFERAGLEVSKYPYWVAQKKCVDIAALKTFLECSVSEGSVVLLHACAHNPTGSDPSHSEMDEIVEVISRRKLIAVADSAYQGYASGDLDTDAYMIRALLRSGAEFFVTQSFAKNMGLYGERFGMMHIVTQSPEIAQKVMSQLKLVIRPMYSSPPIHGAKIVVRVLGDDRLRKMWLYELKEVSERILHVRHQLAEGLKACGDWSHITRQIGMFSFTGMTPVQIDQMISKWHIYMLRNGRISLAGINDGNLAYVIQAMIDCVCTPNSE